MTDENLSPRQRRRALGERLAAAAAAERPEGPPRPPRPQPPERPERARRRPDPALLAEAVAALEAAQVEIDEISGESGPELARLRQENQDLRRRLVAGMARAREEIARFIDASTEEHLARIARAGEAARRPPGEPTDAATALRALAESQRRASERARLRADVEAIAAAELGLPPETNT